MACIALLASCKKDVETPPLASAYNLRSIKMETNTNLFHLTPASKDSGVDIYTNIYVATNLEGSRLDRAALRVFLGDQEIAGRLTTTDSTALFVPFLNFKPETKYTVVLSATINSEAISRHTQFNKSTIETSYHFTTMGEPAYVMERPSQQVTASARDGAKMVQIGDYLYLYGGWKGNQYFSTSFNEIYRSQGDLTSWEQLPDAPWIGRHTFGLGKIGNDVFVYGGDQNAKLFDVWKTTDGMNFTQVSQDLSSRVTNRYLYGACVHKNKLFMMGGQASLEFPDEGYGDVWASPNGALWRRVSDSHAFLAKNISGAAVSYNGKIWVIGGGYYNHPDSAQRWTNKVFSSGDGVSWQQEPDAPWEPREYGDLCVWDNRLWVVGGNNGKNLRDIWYMNKDGSWVQFIPHNSFTARHASAIAVYNDELVLACGDLSNECWVIRK